MTHASGAPRILVVDDSLTVRMELQESFEEVGLPVEGCSSLGAAREAIRRGGVALVVLDVLLPDGDGIELLHELKSDAAFERLPVMLLTSEGEVRDRVRGLKVGASDYIGKPFDSAYVVARARELLPLAAGVPEPESPIEVLIIDDSLTLRTEMKRVLEDAGYSVVTARDGEEGLKLAAQRRPAVVVVDGNMPGMSGAQVVRRVRQDAALRRTPCLLLTGSQGHFDEVEALDAGADAFVRKSEASQVLLVRLAALLRSRGGPAAVPTRSNLMGSRKALAVDDSPTYLAELATQLNEEGFDVALARSGEEALELLAVQTVECVLLDLMMPGMSGQETCRRIKERPAWRDIPVVILTGRDDESAMVESINAGADDYVSKSSDFEVLKARLRAQMRRKQYEQENQRMLEELRLRELEAAQAAAARELARTRAALMADLEQKNAQLEQANSELEAFSYSVSHDLRAPLRHIAGFADLLERHDGSRLDDTGRRYVEKIVRSAQEMGALIDDLLAFSRMGRSELVASTVDLDALVRQIVPVVERDAPGRLVEWEVGDLPAVTANREMLRVVLVNLLSNAVKYTSQRVRARIEISATSTPDEVVVLVRDNGAGFDMAQADKLFGVFQRLHRQEDFEGYGIGLANVRRIIARHGGRTWAEGRPGEGATFYFTLPQRRHQDRKD